MFPQVQTPSYPPQPFPIQQQRQDQTYHSFYNSLPNSPGLKRTQDRPFAQTQPQLFRPVLLPEQYAHPLRRASDTSSLSSPRSLSDDSAYNAEHMLRRKTPNGTLSAGYDGTPVEWADSKPHAMKHILLPVTNGSSRLQSPPTSVQNIDYMSSLPIRQQTNLRYAVGADSSQQLNAPSGNLGGGADQLGGAWIHPVNHAGGIDSVLNQVPMQPSPGYIYPNQNGIRVPTVLQPMYQPCMGPTASNEGGPYGPYWPDGRFIPYRPAALQDHRFHQDVNANQASWNGIGGSGYANAAQTGWQPNNRIPPVANTRADSDPYNSAFQSMQTPSGLQRNVGPTEYPFPSISQVESVKLQGPQGYSATPYPSHGTPNTPLVNSHHSFQASNYAQRRESHQETTSQIFYDRNQPPTSDSGFVVGNLQFRDQVLTWAHSVYVDLLTSLHQTRKYQQKNRLGNGQQNSARGIYPKPPRQPGANFSANHTTNLNLNGSAQAAQKQTGAPRRHSLKSPERSQGLNEQLTNVRSFSLGTFEQGEKKNEAVPHVTRSFSTPSSPGRTHDQVHKIRRTSGSTPLPPLVHTQAMWNQRAATAQSALEILTTLCERSKWHWIDGMLLGGCLAYGLADYTRALQWYSKILELDPDHVEAISNLAATLLSLHRREEAETYWLRSVKLRPSYFEAVEHLIGLLCGDHRGKEAVDIIEFVERSLRIVQHNDTLRPGDYLSEDESETSRSSSAVSEFEDKPAFDFDIVEPGSGATDGWERATSKRDGFGSSGYAIPGSENGRMLALVHAKGNMMYALGDNVGAAKAFEDAVLIGSGRRVRGIAGLIQRILSVVSTDHSLAGYTDNAGTPTQDPILLLPDKALQTSKLIFPGSGDLPGLKYVNNEMSKKAAISTTSNSLLSLAKIFQDGMSSSSGAMGGPRPASGVRDILALYYLSLSLQPSPSTANNVGILLASVQHSAPSKAIVSSTQTQYPSIPGVLPGSGVALALAYYNYGLNLDSRHAHLYTNFGSLLKDIGQLNAAIKMYELAVQYEPNFDIALANLANAVKDQGRISDAIGYYKRAVQASPDFAEAVCGLANALNSVCGWTSRGGVVQEGGQRDRWHVDDKGMLLDAKAHGALGVGWMKRVVDIVEKQLADGETWGNGALNDVARRNLVSLLELVEENGKMSGEKRASLEARLKSWHGKSYEGAKIVRLVERAAKKIGWWWYQDKYVKKKELNPGRYARPQLPPSLSVPTAPTVLPFHTFTCPLSAKQIRMISQRNGLRISCSTLRSPWLPNIVYKPPAPPQPHLNVGYVSSDFNNHPLAHLMQSVFGFHDTKRVKAFCYATTASDNSVHRQQIQREAPVFHDASSWSVEKLVKKIVSDGIHILVNLNGYTRGARNEVFAARPAPIQMSFMGFAGTLGAEWCDYLLADETAVPLDTLRPWRRNIDIEDQAQDENEGSEEGWVYSENIIFSRDTFFCCDHRQSAPDAQEKQLTWDEEQKRRWKMRKELFPTLADDAIILGNFNQLYKIEPTTFRTWLRILHRLPRAILWLLRFPDLGESHLLATARLWAGPDVASRILFTEVAAKAQHISRARVCDLFLDTPECNAHTTAADVLWSGTPLLTRPRWRYKMCSRMAASILRGALPQGPAGEEAAKELVSASEEEYEEAAVRLGKGCRYDGEGGGSGRLMELRKMLYESRWTSKLFDTRRWVGDLEDAYQVVWERWVRGEGGDVWLNEYPRGYGKRGSVKEEEEDDDGDEDQAKKAQRNESRAVKPEPSEPREGREKDTGKSRVKK
ncbi:MAG: hypothetical protein M1824_004068 [Vezdaea acicularis]|nr:MAG: hypothetical protein M1824_004068 [Vezdaea acicularis]